MSQVDTSSAMITAAHVTAVAGAWGIFNIVLTAMSHMNDKRDMVITGRLNGVILTEDHRWHIFYCDWLPLTLGLTVFFVIVATGLHAIAVSGTILTPYQNWLLFFAAVFAFVSVASFIFSCVEFSFLRNSIKQWPLGQVVDPPDSEDGGAR